MHTLNSGIEWFLAHCADHRKLSSHTLKAYRHDLDHFGTFASEKSGDVLLAAIDRDVVRRWLGSMIKLKPRTIHRRLAVVKSLYASMERHCKIETNTLAGLRNEVKIDVSLPRTVAGPQ